MGAAMTTDAERLSDLHADVAELRAHKQNAEKDISEIAAGVKELIGIASNVKAEVASINYRLENGQKKMDTITVQVDNLINRTVKIETAHEVTRGQIAIGRWIVGLIGASGLATAWKVFLAAL